MKLHLASSVSSNLVTRYGPGFVQVNGVRYETSLVITPGSIVAPWPPQCVDDLTQEHLETIIALRASIVLLGDGDHRCFPGMELFKPLIQANVGFEVMDLGAACRTYNVLAHEGRTVAAALIIRGM